MNILPTVTETMLLELDERPWAAYAACRAADPDMFFPDSESDAVDAVRICRGCPVLGECRDWALDTRVRYGVWGGLTEKDRRRSLRKTA
jgi:WhiB family redox-sensing transcriptional regulator